MVVAGANNHSPLHHRIIFFIIFHRLLHLIILLYLIIFSSLHLFISSSSLKKNFSTPVDNIEKKSIFARLKNLDYYP
jgi:hypothetical protein